LGFTSEHSMTSLGIFLVSVAGLGTGSIAWPIKVMRRFQFEQWWFIAMLAGLVAVPWTVVLVSIPDVFGAYRAVDPRLLVQSNLFAFCWGIANVLYALSVVRIGAALTGAILTAFGLAVGVTVPMVFKGSGLFSQAPGLNSSKGYIVILGVAVVLIGTILASMAGFGRQRALKTEDQLKGGFLGGLIMSILGGFLSCGISFAFIYSQGPIVGAVKGQGAGEVAANFAVWAAGLLGGAIVNVAYPAYLMTKNRSWNLITQNWREVGLASVIGVQFICAVVLLGRGMILLGALGASIGFGIQQTMQILGNQGVGFISGEWRGVQGRPRCTMYLAITVLLVGVVIMARGNMLAQ
jgi:L-rhamnose-H+ transport protein